MNPEGQSPPQKKLPSVFYNLVTMLGASLAALSLLLILFLMVLESLSKNSSPYMGIIAFTILPIFLIMGLIAVLVGAWRQHRRRSHGQPDKPLPRIDLNDGQTRRAAIIFTVGTTIFLGMTAFGTYQAYEATESVKFCGETCHSVMEPEFVAYQNSPHAKVACVQCHIGPGAEWFVRSKLSGSYQVYAVLANNYPRPIHTPIKNLRPSRETCEQCHWPEVFYSDRYVVHDYYLPEKDNRHFRLHLLLKTGGAHSETGHTEGIHWHSNRENKVEYVSTDERRQVIPWVRSTTADGTVKVFKSTDEDFDESALTDENIRVMDCIDCHNRPSHRYNPPVHLANRALASGKVSKTIPDIKGIMVDAMEQDYANREEAEKGLKEYIREQCSEAGADAAQIQAAVDVTWDLYTKNYFPEMKTDWKAHEDNIGHLFSDGCFRCHDGNHVTESGEAIPHDCNVCHTIVAQQFDDGTRVHRHRRTRVPPPRGRRRCVERYQVHRVSRALS